MSSLICKTDDVTFAGMPKRGSRYDPVVADMKRLRAGQTLKLPVARSTTIQVAMNRLNSALRQRGPAAPKGCVWEKNALTGKVIGISAVRVKSSRAAKRKAAAAKIARRKPKVKSRKKVKAKPKRKAATKKKKAPKPKAKK